MPKLLLLDMDHTLCDTEGADLAGKKFLSDRLSELLFLNKGEADALSGYFMGVLYDRPEGVEWQRREGEEEGSYRGRLLSLCISKRVAKKLDHSKASEVIGELMEHRFMAFDFFDGVKELLGELRGKYRTVVLSNGPLYSQEPKAEKVAMDEHVDRVVLAGAHPWSKPDPRIFEFVLREEGVDAHDTLHVGDSLGSDIAGAKAAGIPCVWINPGEKSHPVEISPDYILKSVLELPSLLQKIEKTC